MKYLFLWQAQAPLRGRSKLMVSSLTLVSWTIEGDVGG